MVGQVPARPQHIPLEELRTAVVEGEHTAALSMRVGAAPLRPAYADEVGADGCVPDAASAVDRAKKVLVRLPARGWAARHLPDRRVGARHVGRNGRPVGPD